MAKESEGGHGTSELKNSRRVPLPKTRTFLDSVAVFVDSVTDSVVGFIDSVMDSVIIESDAGRGLFMVNGGTDIDGGGGRAILGMKEGRDIFV